jgi:hypothetical protein
MWTCLHIIQNREVLVGKNNVEAEVAYNVEEVKNPDKLAI